MVHAGVVKQAVKILDISEQLLRTGDKGKIRCRFMSRPEFLQQGNKVMFREGKTKMLGEVVEMFTNDQVQQSIEKNPRAKPEEKKEEEAE